MNEAQKAVLAARAAIAQAKAKKLQAISNGGTPGAGNGKGLPEAIMKKLRRWGVKSFDQLATVNTADKKYAYIPKDERDQVKALKESADICVVLSQYFKKPIKELKFYQEEVEFQLKAFGIDSGDEGFDWIPTGVSDSYIDEFNLPNKVAGLFQEVKMPQDPYKWPVLTNGFISRKVGEVTALTTPQVFKTDKTILFESVKSTTQVALPEELNEDSAVDQVKVIRQELMEGQDKGLEIAILEGSEAGSLHYVTQLPDETPGTLISAVTGTPERYYDGIRKRLLAAGASAYVDAGGNHVTETEISMARGKMGKYGVDPLALAYISGVKVYFQMTQLDDVRTLEQYGPQATVLSGELAKYEGSPVIVSEWMREDLHTTGANTNGGANNTGSLIIVNRKRWFVGVRRPIQILVEKNRTQYDVLDMVSFQRKAFQAVLKSDGSNYAAESSGAIVKNIGLS